MRSLLTPLYRGFAWWCHFLGRVFIESVTLRQLTRLRLPQTHGCNYGLRGSLFHRNSKFYAVEWINLLFLFFLKAGFLGLFDTSLASSGHKDRISYILLSILMFHSYTQPPTHLRLAFVLIEAEGGFYIVFPRENQWLWHYWWCHGPSSLFYTVSLPKAVSPTWSLVDLSRTVLLWPAGGAVPFLPILVSAWGADSSLPLQKTFLILPVGTSILSWALALYTPLWYAPWFLGFLSRIFTALKPQRPFPLSVHGSRPRLRLHFKAPNALPAPVYP